MEPDTPLKIQYDSTITENDFDNLNLAILITNSISLLSATIMFFIIVLSRYKKHKSGELYHVKINLWIALSDILFSIISYFNVDDNYMYCSTLTYLTYSLNLFYILLSSSILLNLHLTFLSNCNKFLFNLKKLILNESLFISILFLISLLLSLPPYLISILNRSCVLFHLFDSSAINIIMLWLTIGNWEYLLFLYCVTVSIYIYYKMNTKSKEILNSNNNNPTSKYFNEDSLLPTPNPEYPTLTSNYRAHRRRPSEISTASIELVNKIQFITKRILIYPIIPLFTQSFYILINTYFLYTGIRTLIPLYLFYVIPYSAGFLNAFFFFLLDPTAKDLLFKNKQNETSEDKGGVNDSDGLFFNNNNNDNNRSSTTRMSMTTINGINNCPNNTLNTMNYVLYPLKDEENNQPDKNYMNSNLTPYFSTSLNSSTLFSGNSNKNSESLSNSNAIVDDRGSNSTNSSSSQIVIKVEDISDKEVRGDVKDGSVTETDNSKLRLFNVHIPYFIFLSIFLYLLYLLYISFSHHIHLCQSINGKLIVKLLLKLYQSIKQLYLINPALSYNVLPFCFINS
ncbi:hypothetical protein K502DRAFT_151025 [Neoconidiobolus thromboides FSU 785]|nr:hypothetical protein K502DRAFT_151025 [Neoconidiobolus thromboides FSU 785]